MGTQYSTANCGTSTVYTYDGLDRLTGIEQRSTANAPTSRSEFVYDFASRKAISREFTYTNGAWQQTDEKRRVFDGMDVIQERNSANEVTAQLVRDGNIGGILSRTTATGAAFYGYDGNGNVSLLTDSAGADVGHYRYDAFGNTLEAVGVRAGENPYRFSTKELHGASGLYDYGFRFYSPGLGRWLNRDPLGEEGGINLYGAMGNDLINNVDEYGLVWTNPWYWLNDQINDFLEPPKSNPLPDEDPAETLAREKEARDKLTVKSGAAAWKAGANTVLAVAPIPKVKIPVTGISRIPSGGQLFRAATRSYKGTALNLVGRALSKHPEVVGGTKSTIRLMLKSDKAMNQAAQSALKSIMRNGIRTTPYVPRYGGRIIQSKISRGYGARWYSNGKFIGFIGP